MTPQWSLEPCGRGGSPWRTPQNPLKHQQTPSKDERLIDVEQLRDEMVKVKRIIEDVERLILRRH